MLIVPDSISHLVASLKRASEEKEKLCLKGLKCLNKKNCSVHRQMNLNCDRVIFIKSTLKASLENAFNCVSTMSSF